jgi:5'-nucleotidase
MIGGTPLVSALFRHESTVDIANRIGVDIGHPRQPRVRRRARRSCCARHGRRLRGRSAGGSATASCALGPQPAGRASRTSPPTCTPTAGGTLRSTRLVRDCRRHRASAFIGADHARHADHRRAFGRGRARASDEAQAINAEAARLKAQGIEAMVAVIHEGGDAGTPGLPLEWNDARLPPPARDIFDIAWRLSPGHRPRVLRPHRTRATAASVDGRGG